MKKKLMATVLAGVMAASMLADRMWRQQGYQRWNIYTVEIHSVDVYFFCRRRIRYLHP